MAHAREDLLNQLREMRERRSDTRAEMQSDRSKNADRADDPVKAFDFSKLKDYEQLRIQRAAAEYIGLSSPFFRQHEQVTGVSSRIDGREMLNFASYDYLGLNAHPEVRAAAAEAASNWGISATASRLVGGERPYHRALETALADTYGVDDAIVMTSGHATNVTTIGTLLGPKDLVLTDALIHNSITEGCRLAGAQRMTFPHNDTGWIDDYLSRHRDRYENVLIVVEGLYSMDGDWCDLAELIRIKSRHQAWLMVDEAHAFGVLGQTGRGLAEHTGVDPRAVEIWMGTLSKTLAGCGGYIAGSEALIDYLKHRAPGFVFSVGLAAPVAASALKALEIMHREPDRVARLARAGRRFRDRAKDAGLDTGLSRGFAVTPIITGSSTKAAVTSAQLFQRGINVLPIIFPAVPERSARLRFFLTSQHDDASVDAAVEAMADQRVQPA